MRLPAAARETLMGGVFGSRTAGLQSSGRAGPGRSSRRAALGTVVVMLAGLLSGTASTAAPARAGEPDALPFVQVRIDEVTPQIITADTTPRVTVAGTVINVGDRTVRDVMVRLESTGAVASSAGLRTNLDGTNDQFRPAAPFVTVASELERGQVERFALTASVGSDQEGALEIDRPGVYPIMVNVNGTPDYGEPSRLDDARFLLPVTGLIGAQERSSQADGTDDDNPEPVALTLLWPLADRPHLSPGLPGGTVPVQLVDDELAGSLAPGGRLDVLLASAEAATTPETDPTGAVHAALCLAVDPDLLVTVSAMTRGYVVADRIAAERIGEDGPVGRTVHPGAGQSAAIGWLERLRRLAHRTCVTAIPFAQADLDALARVGDPGLSAAAIASAPDIIDSLLGTESLREVTVLADDGLTVGAAELLTAQGYTVAVTAADCAAQDSTTGVLTTADVTPRRVSPQVVTAPFDPVVGAALAATGSDPAAPTYLDSSLRIRLGRDSPTARRQDALGALLWRGLEATATPRSQLVVPPTYWSPHAGDAHAVFAALENAVRSGFATARPLPEVITQARDAVGPPPHLPAEAPIWGRIDDNVISEIGQRVRPLWGLTAALTVDPRTGLTGAQYTAPLREDMLRALTQAEPPGMRNALATFRLATTAATIDDLIRAVTIVHPAGSYTLATEYSPLPLALRNDLAVPIRVRLQVDAPPGMTVTDVGEIELPPGYLPLRVPVEVHYNQRVVVDVSLLTPEGMPLGEPARLSVHANAYGKVLFIITIAAAVALGLLTGRRLWHRYRGQPDRADLDRPGFPERSMTREPVGSGL